ncbi:hypothetical protein EPUS_09447 [Endocarpon pusillum Z07020]|uniref:Major facilitator superfamily (MFS) profile domain-containing protein n=1 Tax=Endocarpon pusillum (strain Z07020 / HMAS-L-300199) TaxID=1263415 RepID=U1GIX9_ENDPU|nr:uncharacterized protein EPUS_09447 [Endocarpon pusillum Z07020]ERF72093.1 hypothetical protein EPUS_09447 [Endocarpon pusillum Z07020]
MSARRRWMIVLTTGLMTFTVSLASSIFSTAIFVTAEEFRVSSEIMILGVSLYVLGFSFGPLVWGPFSEAYGRTRPLFTGMAVFIILQIPVGVAQNLETIFICRFLAGVAGSSPLAIVAGIYVDFMEPVERGMATAVYAGAAFAGPAAGPIIGSFITQSHLGWRWMAWITMIMAALFTFLAWITTPETFEPTLLKWKAERLRHERKDWSLHAKSEEQKLDMRALLTKYLTKPMYMIVLEPILIVMTVYISICYGILYLTFEAYPLSFEFERSWSPTLASLPFIGLFIGVLLACIILAVDSKIRYGKHLSQTKKLNPEDRVPPMIVGSFVLPAGLFLFAWTSDPSTPWPSQVVAGIPIGCGIILVFVGGITYIVDVYLLNAASAVAINTFIRSAIAAGFPMFATYMYRGLVVDWATSVLGFVCIALIPFPLIFWYYGKMIRGSSHYAFNIG